MSRLLVPEELLKQRTSGGQSQGDISVSLPIH